MKKSIFFSGERALKGKSWNFLQTAEHDGSEKKIFEIRIFAPGRLLYIIHTPMPTFIYITSIIIIRLFGSNKT